MLFPRPRAAEAVSPDENVIHPTAVVAPGARLGTGVEIAPHAVVGSEVTLGDRVHVGIGAVLMGAVHVGDDTRLWPYVVLGGEPQDSHFDGSPSTVRIGARCEVREYVTVHRGTGAGTETVVGDDVMLMANCHVAHNCLIDDGAILVNGALLAGHVHVGAKAFVSGNALVHQFVRIGRLVMIGGSGRVNRDVPPFGLLSDLHLSGINKVGVRRAGVSSEAQRELRELYRLLRAEVGSLSEILPRLREVAKTPEGMEVVEFLEADSERGFCGF